MRNSNIWGDMFSEKSRFWRYFHEIIMILDFWDYNGALHPKGSDSQFALGGGGG